MKNATYSSHGAPCSARDLFPCLITILKVRYISMDNTRISERHSSYHSDSRDTFIPLIEKSPYLYFSGTSEVPKGEVNYEVWSFEVKCLQSAETPEDVLSQAIRRSLRGLARGMLVHIGISASSEEIFNKLDGFNGYLSTAEDLMQQFYGDSQEGESIVSYESRSESTIMKAIKLGHIDT